VPSLIGKRLKRGCIILYALCFAPNAHGYSFDMVVPDVRQPASLSGGSACPVPAHQLFAGASAAAPIDFRWSTALSTNPVTIITADQTAAGSLDEIEQTIQQSISVWTAVSGTTLSPASFAPLTRTTTQDACGADGLNSVCFDQLDAAFTPGVLAFARIVTADRAGLVLGANPPSVEPGQILDADVYFSPDNATITFATPQALAANPQAYDMESLMVHELGHCLGFSHTAVWAAMMFPFAPAPGTFSNQRPSPQQLDAPLSDDDRTGLRVLYPDPADAVHTGSISGRILPVNPLSLPANPPGVTGIFGAQVVALNSLTGSVAAAVLGGWSCAAPGPAVFDGTYAISRLPVGASYLLYAEPLDGAVSPGQVAPALTTLCRNSTTDPGWPPLQACTVPAANVSFTTRTLGP
jgi:hypothetical protein